MVEVGKAIADLPLPFAAVVLGTLGIRLLLDLRGEEGPADVALPPLGRLTILGLTAGAIGGIYGLGGAPSI